MAANHEGFDPSGERPTDDPLDTSPWSLDVAMDDRTGWEDHLGGGWVNDPRSIRRRVAEVVASNVLVLGLFFLALLLGFKLVG